MGAKQALLELTRWGGQGRVSQAGWDWQEERGTCNTNIWRNRLEYSLRKLYRGKAVVCSTRVFLADTKFVQGRTGIPQTKNLAKLRG